MKVLGKEVIYITLVILLCLGAGCSLMVSGHSRDPSLGLSDYLHLLGEDTVVVMGEAISPIEREVAAKIVESLKNLTGYKPKLSTASKVCKEHYLDNDMVIIGVPGTNSLLSKIYKSTEIEIKEVTAEYPGEGKGIIRILKNPWDREKILLLVVGSDLKGLKVAESNFSLPYKVPLEVVDSLILSEEVQASEVRAISKEYLLKKEAKLSELKSIKRVEFEPEGPAREIITQSFPNLSEYFCTEVWKVVWSSENCGQEYVVILSKSDKEILGGWKAIKSAAPGIIPLT